MWGAAVSGLRAISLWQPWATAMASGLKRNETRGFQTKHRGEIAIHAAKHWDRGQRDFLAIKRACGEIPWDNLPFGAIVAVVDISDVWATVSNADLVGETERSWGDYGPNRYAWSTNNLRPLREPVPCSGQQGMWTLDGAIEALVRAQLP
jgi:hypothetical protein